MINQSRLTADLQELGELGRVPGGGITRRALGEADRAARSWLQERMTAAGLEVRVDGALNLIGRLPAAHAAAPSVVIGSHLDTVPQGGMFDGALGVLAGLECARVLRERGDPLPWHLEIINFTDEEGHHNAGTVGSRAMLGMLDARELYAHKSHTACLADSLAALGYDPQAALMARRPHRDFRAYFELHIEQGTHLEDQGYEVGIVTGIVGIYRYAVTIVGQPGHAGTVPMDQRRDALVRSAPLFTLLPQWVRERSSQLVATIGQLELLPGAVNVIPGLCKFTVELRALDSSHMRHMRELLADFVAQYPGSSLPAVLEKDAEYMDETLMCLLEAAAGTARRCRMPSWAGHDAQSFAPHIPSAMLFVPSHRGVSHCPQEWTDFRQAARGAQVLLDALRLLAAGDGRG